jgi:hypothetical protein
VEFPPPANYGEFLLQMATGAERFQVAGLKFSVRSNGKVQEDLAFKFSAHI